jgi:tRNA(Ile)-lysidine synthase
VRGEDPFRRLLGEHPAARRWVVAYSGGMDSRVLLDLCRGFLAGMDAAPRLEALHVDHGVHADSAHWALRCTETCEAIGVACSVRRAEPGSPAEDRLRRARYQVFESFCQEDDLLLLAHHQDDQAETVLLRLLRGAGPAGLAGMPSSRPCGRAILCRPLLEWPRERLREHAVSAGLDWIEDPSNAQPSYARNYLRREIMPRLEARWPGAGARIGRAAAHCADAAEICSARADEDLAGCVGNDRFGQPRLRLAPWRELPLARRRMVLREWLKAETEQAAEARSLETLVAEVIEAAPDRQPRLVVGAMVVRRFDDALYLLPRRSERAVAPRGFELDPGHVGQVAGAGRVSLLPEPVGGGVRAGRRYSVMFRSAGLLCRLKGRPAKPLKQVLAEAGVPPWLRDSVPLLVVDGELAAVGGVGVCEGFEAGPGEPAVRLVWSPACDDSASDRGLALTT